jgi:hypothetical protein
MPVRLAPAITFRPAGNEVSSQDELLAHER